MNRKAHAACNFNYLFKNKGLLKVTSSHVYCKCMVITSQKQCQMESLLLPDHKQEVIYGLLNSGNSDDLE